MILSLWVNRDSPRLKDGKFKRGKLYIYWHIGWAGFQSGGWWPKVAERWARP